ncbi:MAG: DUF1801 domain-containing protein [Actinobacteria bacterium]|nr:DUF1801 domain-containing protein [Actinomycetota bacterium]
MGAVLDYIGGLDEPGRSRLGRLHQRAIDIVPGAEEGTSYGMAALRYRGRPLIAVIVTATGYSAYPFSPAVVVAAVGGRALKTTKGGIKFTDGDILPDDVYDALVSLRRDEIDAAFAR